MSQLSADALILVLNAGSTSLKAGLFAPAPGKGLTAEKALLTAEADGLGQDSATLRILDAEGTLLAEKKGALRSPGDAIPELAEALREHGTAEIAAIGHRIVHGGPRLLRHAALTADTLEALQRSVHFAPLHLPPALKLVEAARRVFDDVPQFACFDTAFHNTMPETAKRLAIPERYAREGVRRYGFHGLSYESVVEQLRSRPEPLPRRVVCAHLGGGSSLCAIHRGRSVDTTMGLSPTGGVPMATRSGDLDPGVVLLLARSGRLSPDALEKLLNQESGLTGICGQGDMQQLERARQSGDQDAGLAFDIFVTAVAKEVAGLTVSLGGLDLLVFTGGIGEHSAPVRAAVVQALAPFGFRLDGVANERNAANIATIGSKAPVVVIPAQEDAMIAVHTRTLLQAKK